MANNNGISPTRLILGIVFIVPLAIVAFLYIWSEPVYQKVPFRFTIDINGDTTFHSLPDDIWLVNPRGDTLRNNDLLGSLSVISFFTAADDPLKKTTVLHGNLKRIYDNIDWEKDPSIRFISISTGDNDSLLAEYEQNLEINPDHWVIAKTDSLMLNKLGKQSMVIPDFIDYHPGEPPFTAQTVALLDKKGIVRDYFIATDLQQERKIQETIVALWRLEYPNDLGTDSLKSISPFEYE